MELKTISASKFTTYEECPARYYAENVARTPRPEGSSVPARKGSVVHNALEPYVKAVYIDKDRQPDAKWLEALLNLEWIKEFRRPPVPSDPDYVDVLDMVRKWIDNTGIDEDTEVLLVEEKMSMEITTKDGPRTYNFIFDRLDLYTDPETGKRILKVVDYKTWRQYLGPDELREKPQCRMYGFAAQALFKHLNPDEIWVCFDQLRYNSVAVKLTRDDNLATWKYIKETANRILAETGTGEERLGPGCMFCVKKATCKTLTKNIDGGGIFSLAGDRDAMARRRLELESASKAIKYALEEVDNALLSDAMDAEEIEYTTENYQVKFKATSRTSYDPDTVRQIIGDTLFERLSGTTVKEIEKLLQGNALDSNQKSRLRSSAKKGFSDPKPKITQRIIKD